MATEDEKDVEEVKENIAEKGDDSQSEKDRVDESVGGQEKLDDTEDTQSAEDRVDESEGTKETESEVTDNEEAADLQESENFEEVIAAQSAKISALESELESLKVKFDELMNKDEWRDFGGQVNVPEGNPTEDKRNAVFENYAGSKAKNYY